MFLFVLHFVSLSLFMNLMVFVFPEFACKWHVDGLFSQLHMKRGRQKIKAGVSNSQVPG